MTDGMPGALDELDMEETDGMPGALDELDLEEWVLQLTQMSPRMRFLFSLMVKYFDTNLKKILHTYLQH